MDYLRPVEALIPGVQGRVLGVLTRTESELTMRAVAGLAGVSPNQAAVALNHLRSLGVVERREVGRAALVRLVADNEATRALLSLPSLIDAVLARLRAEAARIEPRPASLVVFGSFATRTARATSDLDVLAVRPTGVPADRASWRATLGHWSDGAARIAGNPVDLLEVGADEVPSLVDRPGSVWEAARREGILLAGEDIGRLGRARS